MRTAAAPATHQQTAEGATRISTRIVAVTVNARIHECDIISEVTSDSESKRGDAMERGLFVIVILAAATAHRHHPKFPKSSEEVDTTLYKKGEWHRQMMQLTAPLK